MRPMVVLYNDSAILPPKWHALTKENGGGGGLCKMEAPRDGLYVGEVVV